MSAYAVLGLSGTGKSTLTRGLVELGYDAVDGDTLAKYQNVITGIDVPQPYEPPFTAHWLEAHRWVWDEQRLQSKIGLAEGDIIICGDASNAEEFYPFFAKIIGLVADDETITKRLQIRESLRWAEGSPDLAMKLERNKSEREELQKIGAIIIDATQSPEQILRDVVYELFGSKEQSSE